MPRQRATGPLAITADTADTESLSAFGPNLLDPASRGAALEAGMRQADEVAAAVVRRYWTEAATSSGDHSSQPADQS